MKKKMKKKEPFEFCKVCKLNHDQGRSHIYFPSHTKSLLSFLSRFNSKLSDARFFLKNPSPLLPEHASRNRLWCVFCDSDIDELGSSFACSNVIKHLASMDHLKSLKHFFWKNGGGMDRMDSFRISEEDLAKWEKQCKSLKAEAAASSEGLCRHSSGPSNDIHNKLGCENVENFEKNTVYSHTSGLPIGVLPLPNNTDERYQISQSELSSSSFQNNVASLSSAAHSYANFWNSKDLTVSRNCHDSILGNGMKCSADGYTSGTGLYQVNQDEVVKGQSSSLGTQDMTQISCVAMKEARGNVHSGAPPPWFGATEENPENFQLRPGLGNPASSKSRKSQMLNPRRIGAAWAEKRKIELEREKRGEIIPDKFGDDWLPNFGGVWQSGSRKESRKEFESGKQKLPKEGSLSDMPLEFQPYISKRMRRDVNQ